MPPTKQPPHSDTYEFQDRLHVRLLSMKAVVISTESWTYNGMRNGFWRLYVHGTGGALLSVGNAQYPIPPNRVCLVPAWTRIDSRCDRQIEQLFMHFDIVGLSEPIVRRWFDKPVMLPEDPLSEHLSARVSAMLKQRDHDVIVATFAAKALAVLSIGRLLEHLDQERGDGSGGGNILLRRLAELSPVLPALRCIDDRLAEPATNAELAERCAMSEDHFIRIFRRCVGQTPACYALERRVAFAAERLVFSEDSLEQIAEDAGFANRFHFSRVFTGIIGVPPAKYRKLGQV